MSGRRMRKILEFAYKTSDERFEGSLKVNHDAVTVHQRREALTSMLSAVLAAAEQWDDEEFLKRRMEHAVNAAADHASEPPLNEDEP